MRLFILLLLFVAQLAASGQDFTQNRVTPILSAHTDYAKVLFSDRNFNKLNCPPKLTKNQKVTFSFLDSLTLNPELETQLLHQFINSSCSKFYAVAQSYSYAKPFIDSALKSQAINLKYDLIPLTISGCNPNLKYLGDKSGAWQLSFVNARKYGLAINQWYDERNDLAASSKAAATYLKFLNQYYLNNEILVVTAFYTSIPYVNKTIAKLDTVNSTNFYNALTPEVQGYFSYLKVWSDWLVNFNLSKLNNQTNKWTEVFTNDTLSFDIISQFMEIPLQDLQLMNPVFVGQTVLPNSPHSFYLPKDKANTFNQKYTDFIVFQAQEKERKAAELAKLKKQMKSGIPDLDKYKAVTYTVRSGDVLGKIADRNNVKVSQIKQWNRLKSNRINVGQKLVLYVPKNTKTALPKETTDNKIATKPTMANPGKGTPIIYTVKNGESLWLISKKFPGVSSENIMEWNGCTDKIAPGMKLKIYEGE